MCPLMYGHMYNIDIYPCRDSFRENLNCEIKALDYYSSFYSNIQCQKTVDKILQRFTGKKILLECTIPNQVFFYGWK